MIFSLFHWNGKSVNQKLNNKKCLFLIIQQWCYIAPCHRSFLYLMCRIAVTILRQWSIFLYFWTNRFVHSKICTISRLVKCFFGATGKFNDLLPSIVKLRILKNIWCRCQTFTTDEIKNALDARKSNIQSCHVSYRKQRFHSWWKVWLWHVVVFQPGRYQFFDRRIFRDLTKRHSHRLFRTSYNSKTVKDAGLRLDLEAPTVEAPSMTAALDKFIGEL